jgi:hypothetical protein
MANEPTTPQRQYRNPQDVVSPDIDVYYNNVVKDIDAFRSRFNASTSNIQHFIALQDLDSVFSSNSNDSTSPQESRCNAFFRMIGFPVIDSEGTRSFSPGFDPDTNRNADKIQKKLDIANSALLKFTSILDERELYPKGSTTIFQTQGDNATALAISSIFPRPFDKQLKVGLTPLDIDVQVFDVPDRANVQSDFSTVVGYPTTSTHILKPFMVDPRIDISITPSNSRICVPFLEDKSKTQLSRGNYLKRPYIERVMRVRFNNTNVIAPPVGKEEINQFINDILSFVKTNSDITTPTLVEFTNNALSSLHKSEIMVFTKFVNILEALVSELVKSIIETGKIRANINWKPIPNVNGPEFGCTTNDVNGTDPNNKKIESNINELENIKFLTETEFDIGLNAPDLGNFSFSNIDDIIFGSLKNVSQFYDKQLTTLNRRRDETASAANDCLRKIEIITGEFSGLGLLDIIAIQAALWVIDPNALLGLIDDDAVARMQKINSLKTDTSGRMSPLNALTEFETKLSEIYVLINAFYTDIFNYGGKK